MQRERDAPRDRAGSMHALHQLNIHVFVSAIRLASDELVLLFQHSCMQGLEAPLRRCTSGKNDLGNTFSPSMSSAPFEWLHDRHTSYFDEPLHFTRTLQARRRSRENAIEKRRMTISKSTKVSPPKSLLKHCPEEVDAKHFQRAHPPT